jgi:chorismate lyase/3-hydroxybenzoate synthase
MSAAPSDAPIRLAVDLVTPDTLTAELARCGTLAVFGFGADAPMRDAINDIRYLRVPLAPLSSPKLEIWRTGGVVTAGNDGNVSHAQGGELQFGAIEMAEGNDGIAAAAERAYAQAAEFWRRSGYPHLLRIWNYLDAIVEGEGDSERYRQFCVGRARGLVAIDTAALPAATAIGCNDGRRILQVYWLAARRPGTPLENPRQTSAWCYPRQYGPQSPCFARALLPPSAQMPLFISGTASIVGHASLHVDSLPAQLDETFANLASLRAAAREQRPALPEQFDASSRLKVYVRDAANAGTVAALLRERLDASVPWIMLHGDVCRRELQVEIETMHGVTDNAVS